MGEDSGGYATGGGIREIGGGYGCLTLATFIGLLQIGHRGGLKTWYAPPAISPGNPPTRVPSARSQFPFTDSTHL